MSTSGRRRFLRTLGGGLAAGLVLLAPEARAAQVEVNATLGRSRIEVGQSVYLQIEVTTDGRNVGSPQFPGLEGVEVSSRGSSSGVSIEIGGGRQIRRTTKTFTYVVSPKTAGAHEIEVEVEVDGQVHRPASAPKLFATGGDFVPELERDKAGDEPPAADADVIVWPVVDKSRAYVGEQIVYDLQIWDRSVGNLAIATAPTFKDFWSEDLDPNQHLQRRGGERRLLHGTPYRVFTPVRRALFPQKAGTLTIGGPEIEQQARMGPFFGGSGPPRHFLGRSLAIEVMPLPAEGQPANFRPNNVGQLRITSEVDRTSLRQGEAVRLSVRISGTGNIALVELPKLPELDGLRSYEPKPETPKLVPGQSKLQGSRVYTMLVVADAAGKLEIPAIELPYFDPEAEAYRVAKTKPITLEVEANPNAVGAAELDAEVGEPGDDEELLAPPIASDSLVRVTARERWLTNERWWLGSLAAPGLLGLGVLIRKLREQFGPDDRARARAEELARRRTLLNEANAALEAGEEFYPKLATLLQAAAVLRAGPEGVGLTRERLMQLLGRRDVPSEEIELLRDLLDACDAARFGSGSGDVEQRREHLARTRDLLGRRSWRPE